MSTDTDSTDDPTDGETTSPAARWWLTNDVIAGVLVVGFYATLWAVGRGLLDPTVLTGEVGLAMIAYVGIAVAWAFGTDAVRAWRGDQ